MNKRLQFFLFAIAFALLFAFICCLLSIVANSDKKHFEYSNQEIKQIFEDDYDMLFQATQYLNSLEDMAYACIESTDGTMILEYGKKMEITDKNALAAVSQLFENDYFKIRKKNNTIHFYRWKDPFGCFMGFAFSTDGTGELDIQFITEQIPLNKPNWYYYVSDYEEWRVQN